MSGQFPLLLLFTAHVMVLAASRSPLHRTPGRELTSVPASTPQHLSKEGILATEAALHTVSLSLEGATPTNVDTEWGLVWRRLHK